MKSACTEPNSAPACLECTSLPQKCDRCRRNRTGIYAQGTRPRPKAGSRPSRAQFTMTAGGHRVPERRER